ncbi:MAG: hypothetical protein V8R46_01150 [Eubacterium ramulus]
MIASGRIQDMILVQESYMEQKIGDIAETIASDRRKKFVLIAGPSSSGKTTFSHRLSIQMTAHGLKPHPISLDDFYCNREKHRWMRTENLISSVWKHWIFPCLINV